MDEDVEVRSPPQLEYGSHLLMTCCPVPKRQTPAHRFVGRRMHLQYEALISKM